MLLAELVAQVLLFGLALLELRLLLLPDEHVREHEGENDEPHAHRADADRQRPAAGVARVECPQLLDKVHGVPRLASFLPGAALPSACPVLLTWSANTVKFEPAGPVFLVSMTSSSECCIHSELSMLRMKVDT